MEVALCHADRHLFCKHISNMSDCCLSLYDLFGPRDIHRIQFMNINPLV